MTLEPTQVEVEAIIATSHPVEKYGGVQLADSVLDQIAGALRAGELPMLIGHDLRRPLTSRVLDAAVRERPDGFKEVWARIVVDRRSWEEYERDRDAAGAPGGFSFSATEPLRALPAANPAETSEIMLAGDAAHWTDAELIGAAEDFAGLGCVAVARRYQFAQGPEAVLVLQVALPILTSIVGTAAYEALKKLWRKHPTTVLHLHVEDDGREVVAHLETTDPSGLDAAVRSIESALQSRPDVLFWDGKRWQRIR